MFWTAIVLLSLLSLGLAVGLGFALFYLWRFANIIMILEDDFSDAIDSLSTVEESLDKILKMQLFFDSKEVKLVVQEAMSEVKASRVAVNRLVQKFVERSNQKFVVIMDEEDSGNAKEQFIMEQRRMEAEQPPGSMSVRRGASNNE